MATQSKNQNAAESDLDPNQLVQDVGQGDDAALYANAEGAQTGGSRAFHANAGPSNLPNVQQESAALTGKVAIRTPPRPGSGHHQPLRQRGKRSPGEGRPRPSRRTGRCRPGRPQGLLTHSPQLQ